MTERVQPAVPYSVQAADIVRARILGGNYELGERLSEVELSTSLGISRSPLREALRLLANEGLVTMVSGRGVFVADFTPSSVKEILEVRQALDVLAARLAAERATKEGLVRLAENLERLTSALRTHGSQTPDWPADFHLSIYEAADNQRLKEQGWAIHTQIRLARFQSGTAAGRLEQAHEEHLVLLEAIRNHDPELAASRMAEHVEHSAVHIMAQLERPAKGAPSVRART